MIWASNLLTYCIFHIDIIFQINVSLFIFTFNSTSVSICDILSSLTFFIFISINKKFSLQHIHLSFGIFFKSSASSCHLALAVDFGNFTMMLHTEELPEKMCIHTVNMKGIYRQRSTCSFEFLLSKSLSAMWFIPFVTLFRIILFYQAFKLLTYMIYWYILWYLIYIYIYISYLYLYIYISI